MSLFQCGWCGCCENTALAGQGCDRFAESFYDWTGFEDRKGKKLCSACAPTRFNDGTPTEFGKWHGIFPRVFLPLGMFRTARDGNLEHVETGDKNFHSYAVAVPAPPSAQSIADGWCPICGGQDGTHKPGCEDGSEIL